MTKSIGMVTIRWVKRMHDRSLMTESIGMAKCVARCQGRYLAMLLEIKDSFNKLMMLLVTEDSKVLKTFWMVKIFPIIPNSIQVCIVISI